MYCVTVHFILTGTLFQILVRNSLERFFFTNSSLKHCVISDFTNWAKIPLKDEESFILLNRRKSKKKTISNVMPDSQLYP